MNEYIDQIDRLIQEHHIQQHPFYQMLQAGELQPIDIQTFALSYFSHVESFPSCLLAASNKTSDRFLRDLFLENYEEEMGEGDPNEQHANLWMNFAVGLGLQRKEVESAFPLPEVQHSTEVFYNLCSQAPEHALTALYTYESQQPALCLAMVQSLQEEYGIFDEKTLQYFLTHAGADIRHSQEIREGLLYCLKQNPLGLESCIEVAEKAIETQWLLMDGIARQSGIYC